MAKCLITKYDAEVNNPNLPSIYDFDYSGTAGLKSLPWKNVVDKTAALPWDHTSANVIATQYYYASNGDMSFGSNTNNERLVSDYIEVYEGMVISTNLNNTLSVPVIICFDANKQPLGPSETYCLWKNSDYASTDTFTIPAGVKYIVINLPGLWEETSPMQFIKGSKPVSGL